MSVKTAQRRLKIDQDWENARPTAKKKRRRQSSEKSLLAEINLLKGRKGGEFKQPAKKNVKRAASKRRKM